jgi:hypothetical protein
MDEARQSFNAQVLGFHGRKSAAAPWPRSPEGDLFVRRIGDLTVVDIPPCYEAGDMKARVASDADQRVASIFILNPDTP